MTRHFSLLAFILLASGCVSNARWQQQRGEPRPMKPSDTVLIWSNGTVEKWHGVAITANSVSGIPYRTSLECDSCRRSIPRAQVDSMKYRTGPGVAKTSLVFAGIVAVGLVVENLVAWAIR